MTVGWITLDVGEQALVYDLQGRARIETGPKRFYLFREKLSRLQVSHASQSEYLVIRHRDGRISHQAGPCAMYKNPLQHLSIQVKNGISLDANEVLVVYKLDPKSNEVTRYIRHGPTLFIPHANEWLHEFRWHGTDPDNKTRKLPGSLQFTKLQVIPDNFYYNVDEVRTADDALMRVKFMIFYELKDIELMLNSTQDPISDFTNCLCADVVAFASKLTYMEFIEKANELNDLKHYPQLIDRSSKIGYEISKVVFRGYYAAPKLQQMHDNAIAARTRLRISYEKEEQEQELTDVNLKIELERTQLEQKMELENIQHRQAMEKTEQEHRLGIKKQDHLGKIHTMQKEEQAKLTAKKAADTQKLQHYGELNKLGVDMTEYLLRQDPHPTKVIKVIADDKAAVLHLHRS